MRKGDSYWTESREATIYKYHPEIRRRVVVPLHKKDLPKGALIEILKQAGISREELRNLL